MIAELLYPKELKEVIADLRMKEDLNEEALSRYNHYIFFCIKWILFFNAACLLILLHPEAGTNALLFMIGIFFFMFSVLIIELKKEAAKLSFLYNYGEVVEGVVESFGSHKGGCGMAYSFLVDNREKRSSMVGVSSGLVKQKYKKGTPIQILYNSANLNQNIPFIPSLAEIYYLRKEQPCHD